MKDILNNYKTTICGTALIAVGVFGLSSGSMTSTEASALILAGAGFITSKDA